MVLVMMNDEDAVYVSPGAKVGKQIQDSITDEEAEALAETLVNMGQDETSEKKSEP